jgi:hypothetical protein
MNLALNALLNTLGAVRKYALVCSVIAFAIMGMLIGIKANVFLQSASRPELTETLLDIGKSIFEAIGSALLVGALLDTQISRLKAVQAIEKIEMTGSPIIVALERDINEQTRVIVEVEFTLVIRPGVKDGNDIPVFSTTLTKKEMFKALVDIEPITGINYEVFQYAGSSEPWKVDTLKIYYSPPDQIPPDFEDLSPVTDAKSGSVTKYNVRKIKKGQQYSQITIRTKNFIGGIMENHVFLYPAKNLRFDVYCDASALQMAGCPRTKEYPINIFITNTERGYIEANGSSAAVNRFERLSEANAPTMHYRFESERQFLPFQGFSFFLDVETAKVQQPS